MESNFTDNQVWLSSVDEDAFFRLYRKQVTPSQESIFMAKYQIDWKNDNAKKQPDLADLQLKSNFCTICLKTPRKHDRGIFLTMDHCAYPVQWRVVSGFVAEQYFFLFGNDQVYVFENYLFEQLGQSGHFMQMDFGDFFWKTSDNGRGHSILATVILVLLVITATVFLLTVIGVFFKHYKSQSSDNKNESEKTLRDESRLRGLLKNNDALKNKIKAISRKPVAGGTSVIKMTSALLPTARESQKDSLKTNWTEETGVPSVTTQRLKRSYSQAKSNGKMSLPTSKYKWKVTKSGSKSKQKRVPRVRSQSSSFARWKVFKKTKRSAKSTKKERSINKRL